MNPLIEELVDLLYRLVREPDDAHLRDRVGDLRARLGRTLMSPQDVLLP